MENIRPIDSAEALSHDIYDEYIRSSEYLKNVEEIIHEIDDGEKLADIIHEGLESIDWNAVENLDTDDKPLLGADHCVAVPGLQYRNKNGVHTSFLHLYSHDGNDYKDLNILPPAEHTYSMYAVMPRKPDDLSQPNSAGLHVLYVPMPGVDPKLSRPFIVNADVNNRIGLSAKHIADTYDKQHHAAARMIVYEGLATYLNTDEISKISEIKRMSANIMLHEALLDSGQL